MPETTERTEYRVTDVNDAYFSRRFPVVPETSYQAAVEVLQRLRWAKNTAVRIQTRTVIETPWVDLDEGGGDAVIFGKEMLEKVLAGEKTVTRRPVKYRSELPPGAPGPIKVELPCKYKVGRTYALQPGRGQKAVGRIRVLNVRREPSFGAVRCEWGGLRMEGFKSYAEFSAYLRQLYGEVPTGPVDRIEFELVRDEGEGGDG